MGPHYDGKPRRNAEFRKRREYPKIELLVALVRLFSDVLTCAL
jgi:hypothetical protein